jgi:hypothetical protein
LFLPLRLPLCLRLPLLNAKPFKCLAKKFVGT